MTELRALRCKKLLAALAAEQIPITTVSENGRLRFSENVLNREDDGDPEWLDRYVLVAYDNPRDSDYWVWSFRTQRQLKGETTHTNIDTFVIALDLDRNSVLTPDWITTVKFTRSSAKTSAGAR